MARHWKTAGWGYVDQSHEHQSDFQRHNCAGEGKPAYARRNGCCAATGRIALPKRYCRKGAPGQVEPSPWTTRPCALAKQFGFLLRRGSAPSILRMRRTKFSKIASFLLSAKSFITPRSIIRLRHWAYATLPAKNKEADISDLGPDDVVIRPRVRNRIIHPATDQGSRGARLSIPRAET